MKYIRTKNGMLFSTNAPEEDIPKDDCFFEVGDTIEELCDGFIAEEKSNEADWLVISVEDFKKLSDDEKSFHRKDWAFYAFIRTNKGLIYVAQMNEKGEFELL